MDWNAMRQTAHTIASTLRVASSGWGRTNCPFCVHRIGKADRRASLGFYAPYGFFRCFRCNLRLHLQKWDASKVVVIDQAPFHSKAAPSWFVPLYGGPETSATFSKATEYAESRGYDLALRHAVGMGACASGRFNTRIIIPHRDERNEWWGFTARNWLGKCEEPYLYPEGMDRSRLFNEQALMVETTDPALMMEGVCDGILYWPDPVTLGGKPIDEQFKVFRRSKRPMAFVLDGDAWRDGWVAAMRLRLEGFSVGAVRLPPGRDPNDRQYVDVRDVRAAALACIGRVDAVVVNEKEQEAVFYG